MSFRPINPQLHKLQKLGRTESVLTPVQKPMSQYLPVQKKINSSLTPQGEDWEKLLSRTLRARNVPLSPEYVHGVVSVLLARAQAQHDAQPRDGTV